MSNNQGKSIKQINDSLLIKTICIIGILLIIIGCLLTK